MPSDGFPFASIRAIFCVELSCRDSSFSAGADSAGELGTSSLSGLGSTCELNHEAVEAASIVLAEASSAVATPVLAVAVASVATIPIVDVSVDMAGDSTVAAPDVDRGRLTIADEFDGSC
jgi:hypothetical protein